MFPRDFSASLAASFTKAVSDSLVPRTMMAVKELGYDKVSIAGGVAANTLLREQMEREGFVAEDVKTKPMTMLPTLFAGAFKAHHRYVKREVIDEIYFSMKNKADLISKLAEMYNEPIMALVDEPEENEGNLNWTASW